MRRWLDSLLDSFQLPTKAGVRIAAGTTPLQIGFLLAHGERSAAMTQYA